MSEQESGDVRRPPIPFPFRRPTNEGRQFKGPVLTAMGIDRRLRDMAPLPRAKGEAEEVVTQAIGAEIARQREERGWS